MNSPQGFEQSMERLQTIVRKLEGGELPLEESLSLFEEGVRLSKECQAHLGSAELKVEQLLKAGSDGGIETRPFSTPKTE